VPPATGSISWSNSTQTASNTIYVSHLTVDNIDVDIFLALLKINDYLTIQDSNDSANFQQWIISSTPSVIYNSYLTFPVNLVSGTYSVPLNHPIILSIVSSGVIGPQGLQGFQGPTGSQGSQGDTGIQGPTGPQGLGTQGPTGPQGSSGANGSQGPTGPQGTSGLGSTGSQGPTGPQGSGPQGPTGPQGNIGPAGVSPATNLFNYYNFI
jgi:hypothetical protein